MKILLIFLFLLQYTFAGDPVYFSDPNTKSYQKPIQVNKNLSMKEFDEFDLKRYWEYQTLSFSFGFSTIFYEDKNNIFVEENQNYFEVDFSKNLYKYVDVGISSQVNPNFLLIKEFTNIYFYRNQKINLGWIIELGQKINFKNDIDSGYLLGSYGISGNYQSKLFYFSYKHKININKIRSESDSISVLYNFKKDIRFGFEFIQENIDSFKKEYTKEGVLNKKIGLIHQFLF